MSSNIATEPGWLRRAWRLQAIVQRNLTYAKAPTISSDSSSCERWPSSLTQGSGANAEHIRALFDRESGLASPKVNIRAVMLCADRVLLVSEPRTGYH